MCSPSLRCAGGLRCDNSLEGTCLSVEVCVVEVRAGVADVAPPGAPDLAFFSLKFLNLL